MRDYKPQSRQAKRKARGNTLLGIFIGLALGLLIAVGIALYISKMPLPFTSRLIDNATDKKATPQADRNLAESAKPAPADQRRFDFYRILPGQETPVTETEIKQQAKEQAKEQAKGPAASSEPKDVYVVQAGAFQSPAEADALKARLALLGLEASVEPAHLPDKGTVYRVRLGPYAQLDDINRVRSSLSQNGVAASLVKLRTE